MPLALAKQQRLLQGQHGMGYQIRDMLLIPVENPIGALVMVVRPG